MSNLNELSSFKQLLRQVYSVHSTKVRELENEITTLKEKLTEKERESNSSSSECKRCIELEEAFKSCKKALHDQSKLFENFGQKFSIFNSPSVESQDLKMIAKSPSNSHRKIQSANDGNTCRYESAISADESTLTELKVNSRKKNLVLNDKNCPEKTMHNDDNSENFDLYTIKLDSKNMDPVVSDNQNLFKKVMHDEENLGSFDVCTVTFPQQLREDHLNEKSDSAILAPDSLDTSLDPKIVHEKRCSGIPDKVNIAIKTLNSDEQKKNSLKCDGDKLSRKRLSSDTFCDKELKRSNACQKENKSNIKNGGTEIFNLIPPKCIVTRDISDIPIKTDTKVTVKNLGIESDKKVANKNVLDDKVNKNDTPKNANFQKSLKESKLSEISPSLLPTNMNMPLKVIASVDVSTDDDFQDQVSCIKSNQSEDSWDACDKKNQAKKRKNIKCIKTTSKYKMTLDAPPLNYKKPNFKQTKLSRSIFQAKGSTSKKPQNEISHTKKSNFVTIEDDSSQGAIPDCFQTSTPFDAYAKSPFNVDIDATFIPENYQPETTSVKKNAVEKSHLKNGNLFSNISFPDEVESVEKREVNIGKDNDFEKYSFSEELESKENMDSFDRLPLPEEPSYKYKNDVIRKKSERKQLNAFDCKECEKYYSELGLSDKEKKERMKKCSRHRAKYTPPSTPDHFWELEFPDTLECKARGYMNETQKVKLNNICNI